MSVAEKTLLLKQDFDEVYDQGYEDGKNSVVDYLQSAKTVQFNSLNDFGKAEVELNLDNCISLTDFCRVLDTTDKNTTMRHLTINNAQPINMSSMLQCNYATRDEILKQVIFNFNTKNVTSFVTSFAFLQALEIIDGEPLDFSSATNINNMFNGCLSLVEVRFAQRTLSNSLNISTSSLLSTETIQSIIDGLADLTGGTAQTLTLHANVGAKLTDEQKATITAKNWTLVY